MSQEHVDSEPGDSAHPGDEGGVRLSRVGDTIVVSAGPIPLPEQLTDAERAVVQALLAGRTNTEIAEERGKSAKTIANQLYAIYRKLGVGSRDELAAFLMQRLSTAMKTPPTREDDKAPA
jgi:DNA-binding NarL/FixJ family response regulator